MNDIESLLTQIVTKAIKEALAERESGDRLLDIKEASAILCVSKQYLYNNAKRLPFVCRVGRCLRFSLEGINKYLKNHRHSISLIPAIAHMLSFFVDYLEIMYHITDLLRD